MIIDATNVEDGSSYSCDICVIGGGAAGITLARELRGTSFKVMVLEAGGLAPSAESQAFYKAQDRGVMYFPLDVARLRYLGGTTGHWGGACLPLDPIDFEKREAVPNSGWPLTREQLDPFYERAQLICGVGPFNYDPAFWSESDNGNRPLLPLDASVVRSAVFQNSKPLRFGEFYRDDLEQATNVEVLINAAVLEMQVRASGERLDAVVARTPNGRTVAVRAKCFVLATGGIENARQLLLADRVHKAGIGNAHDLVGRYFMDHIYVPVGRLLLNGDQNMRLYQMGKVNGTRLRAGLSLSAEQLAAEQLLNGWVGIYKSGEYHSQDARGSWNYLLKSAKSLEMPDDLLRHISASVDYFAERGERWIRRRLGWEEPVPPNLFNLNAHTEQAPNPDSRVYLGKKLDDNGQRRLVMDWRLTEQDHRSIRRTVEIISKQFGAAGLGRVQIGFSDDDTVWLDPDRAAKIDTPVGSFHHLGTTRMHDSPRQGVVDRNLKVHEMSNLYVTGSSVFTSGGFANPTLTLVALTCRLADHLKTTLV